MQPGTAPGASFQMIPGAPMLSNPGMPTAITMGVMPGVGGVPGMPTMPAGIPNMGAMAGVPGMPMQLQAMQMAMMQQQNAVASQMQQQALMQAAAQQYEKEASQVLEPEVLELQKEYKLDDRIVKDLMVQVRKRNQVEDDVKDLFEILDGARNPAGMLRVKIKEMEDGTYRGTATPDKDVEEVAKKFKLDAQAAAKLSEVLAKRPEDRKRTIRQLDKHLELSNKPSSLVMLMLKDLRNGVDIKDPEYPAAPGSYRHKMGNKGRRSRSRKRRRHSSDSSSSPPPPSRSSGAGPLPGGALAGGPSGARPMTLLERFG